LSLPRIFPLGCGWFSLVNFVIIVFTSSVLSWLDRV
jgi:hypothetical protein